MRSLEVILKERLLTTPQEELGRKRCLVAVMEREQKANAILERLETRYNDAVRDKQREVIIIIIIVKSIITVSDNYIHSHIHIYSYKSQ